MPEYLIDVNLPYHCSLWKGKEFVHQRDLDDEWLGFTNLGLCTRKFPDHSYRDADFSIRVSTSEPPPRVIHFRLGNIKASELFELLYKNWSNIAKLSKEYKLVTVYRDRIEVIS